ncbi:hypothetical protein SAMN04488029_3603 [Reichenbachiella faecimaris]|uniref:SprB repeat-containing protein n=1 Tax=Reichenbachiella faecimaris TaxID=692418 RepID=A0A1W2GN68_REIFA|nr:hypothetical protein [Reichenbachiella faecimaris]SMD38041.1 hypothetical protein SAMN04488029_3603 [Reichenbachiella faecimaris]
MRKRILSLMSLVVFACSDNQEVNCDLSDLALTVSGNENADCNAGATISFDAQGGEGPYLFRFEGSPFQDLTEFNGVPLGGPFLAEVKDAKGCEATLEVFVSGDENTVSFDAETTAAGCGMSGGTISITASGGEGDYQYRFKDENFNDSNTFAGLKTGTYQISVMDGAGCINIKGIKVLSGISFKSDVQPIINVSCATTDCHRSGNGLSDFTNFNIIQSRTSSIKSQVVSKVMPKDGALSDAEIQAIVCWIDDGALNN